MAIQIKDVAITKDYSTWGDIRDKVESWDKVAELTNWNNVYTYSDSANKLLVGQTYIVTVLAEEVTWKTINNEFSSWNDIKTNLTNWNSVLNYK